MTIMTRRGVLALIGALGAELILPGDRRYFLPPRGGWRPVYLTDVRVQTDVLRAPLDFTLLAGADHLQPFDYITITHPLTGSEPVYARIISLTERRQ